MPKQRESRDAHKYITNHTKVFSDTSLGDELLTTKTVARLCDGHMHA